MKIMANLFVEYNFKCRKHYAINSVLVLVFNRTVMADGTAVIYCCIMSFFVPTELVSIILLNGLLRALAFFASFCLGPR